MGLILNIETSTKTCSIAIGKNGKLISEKVIWSDQFVHGEKLHLLIKELFNQENLTFKIFALKQKISFRRSFNLLKHFFDFIKK